MTTNNESNLSLKLAWAKVLLKSCLDVLETHNEPIIKRLRNDVSDFLKDDYNLLKNQKKFNISEGNVKSNDIFYKDCCDKFIDYVKKSHNERVADTSKTIVVEKEVYEAVLRNSVKVVDLDVENQRLKELLIDFTKRIEHYKEVKPDVGFIMFDLGYLANQVKEVLK